jgi:hypothetical protein
MKKNLFFFILLTIPALCFSQEYQKGDTLYVWNVDGTLLWQEPTFSSKNLDSLKLGTPLMIQSVLQNKPVAEKVVNTSVRLKGFWIKAKTGNKTGYVFGGDCYTLNPFPVMGREKEKSLLDRFLGKKTGNKVITSVHKYGKDSISYALKENITFYRNGKEISSYFDGCFDDDYYFSSSCSLTTIYHLMMLILSHSIEAKGLPEEISRPRLRGAWSNVYEFNNVGAIEPQLEILKNGIRLSLSSCD